MGPGGRASGSANLCASRPHHQFPFSRPPSPVPGAFLASPSPYSPRRRPCRACPGVTHRLQWPRAWRGDASLDDSILQQSVRHLEVSPSFRCTRDFTDSSACSRATAALGGVGDVADAPHYRHSQLRCFWRNSFLASCPPHRFSLSSYLISLPSRVRAAVVAGPMQALAPLALLCKRPAQSRGYLVSS